MKQYIFLITSSVLLSLNTNASQPPQMTPLIRCIPTTQTLFGFELTRVSGCLMAPGGAHCGNRISMEILGFDTEKREWVPAGTRLGLPDTVILDQEAGSFRYRYESSAEMGSEKVEIDYSNRTATVDIKFNFGFSLVPEVNTQGAQSSYQCTLL